MNAGSERVGQQASLGSMVKAQKSAGRKSSNCPRRQVLDKRKSNNACLIVKSHFIYVRPK